jgi:heme-degrading monooxygenase HmoA
MYSLSGDAATPPVWGRDNNMQARVTHVQVQPDKVDEATSIYRDSVVPVLKTQNGYSATYLLVDRATGKGMSVTIWEGLEALQASESSGFYQEQVAKFAPVFAAPPTREIYEVSVQA